ncbi:DUF362 domain-containing protein [bacterium]|nr:DUF362 domain-containing protein [bacterium]
MKSKVLFLPGRDKRELLERLPLLLGRLIDGGFSNDAFCGMKVHVGENGNTTFVPADFARVGVRFLKEAGARPFLFETNTLYYGQRGNTVDHLNLAAKHGFSLEKVGAPFLIADGMRGESSARIPVKGKHIREAQIASLVPNIPCIVGLSHFKGHMLSGFGATIKNFSMGCAARGGKLQIHSLSKPWIDVERCTRCGECQIRCPSDAIETKGEDFVIVRAKCTGCAGCIGVCTARAVRIKWNEASESASQKMAEYALAALSGKEAFYVNFLINITSECDCLGEEMEPIHEDVGILASRDPVAVDQACLDMVEEEIGSAHKEVDPEIQLAHGERIGLGKRDYELEEL